MDAKFLEDVAKVQSLQFVPAHGTNHDLSTVKGSTIVFPTLSAGMSPTIATDLFILNENATLLGYIKSDYISPVVQTDALS
mmetsp:Transcript_39594/g.60563  ORF Transcript_39594/g.60563 Transcript_39594/m.60563 type:complete len:81 (+) Transcript_39594:18-260(+)